MGASSLTGRYWTGSVWYWNKAELAPDIEKCVIACEVNSGIGNLTVIDQTHIMLATDSGDISELSYLSNCWHQISRYYYTHHLNLLYTYVGSVEMYKLEVDENSENSLTCLANPSEHDDIVTSLSVNSSADTAVTGSHDCRYIISSLLKFLNNE